MEDKKKIRMSCFSDHFGEEGERVKGKKGDQGPFRWIIKSNVSFLLFLIFFFFFGFFMYELL